MLTAAVVWRLVAFGIAVSVFVTLLVVELARAWAARRRYLRDLERDRQDFGRWWGGGGR